MRALLNLADGATAACAAGDAFAASHAGSGEGSHAAATRSAAGFMTAADKAKLNAATAGATGSTLMARDAYGRAQVLHDRAARRQALPHLPKVAVVLECTASADYSDVTIEPA